MTDEPLPLPIGDREIDDLIDAVFDQAERTIPVLRGHMFSFEKPKTDVETFSADPIVRLEQKLDAVIGTMTALKARVDSIDSVLARLIHRR